MSSGRISVNTSTCWPVIDKARLPIRLHSSSIVFPPFLTIALATSPDIINSSTNRWTTCCYCLRNKIKAELKLIAARHCFQSINLYLLKFARTMTSCTKYLESTRTPLNFFLHFKANGPIPKLLDGAQILPKSSTEQNAPTSQATDDRWNCDDIRRT